MIMWEPKSLKAAVILSRILILSALPEFLLLNCYFYNIKMKNYVRSEKRL